MATDFVRGGYWTSRDLYVIIIRRCGRIGLHFTVVTLGRFNPVSFKKGSWENNSSDVDPKITNHALNILDCVQQIDF